MEKEKNKNEFDSSDDVFHEDIIDDSSENQGDPGEKKNDAEMGSGDLDEIFSGADSVEQSEPENDAESGDTSEMNPVEDVNTKKRKKKRGHGVRTAILAVFIVAVSVAISYLIITGMNDIFAFSKPTVTAEIVIPKGATATEITKLLHKNGIINNQWSFRLVISMRDDSNQFQEGKHYFSAQWDYESIIDELKTIPSENTSTVTLTFQEGIKLETIAEMLEKNNVCTADLFLKAINNPSEDYEFSSYLKNTDTSLKYFPMEGYAFPDTYTFYKNEGADVVANKLLLQFDRKMSDANLYSLISSSKYSLDEIITLASIIQAEAGMS